MVGLLLSAESMSFAAGSKGVNLMIQTFLFGCLCIFLLHGHFIGPEIYGQSLDVHSSIGVYDNGELCTLISYEITPTDKYVVPLLHCMVCIFLGRYEIDGKVIVPNGMNLMSHS